MEEGSQCEGIFTYQEALDFLENLLGISDASELLPRDPLSLLNKLSVRYLEVLPFQNITNMSAPIGAISVPSLEEIKSDHLTGRGGVCYGHNRFIFELLCAMGYKAHLSSGCVENPGDHLVVIVDAMPNGDTTTSYLLDNGFGFPHNQAIPLDFDTESPVYNLGHTIFKITREGDVYTRVTAKHGKTFVCSSEFDEEEAGFEWARTFTFTTKSNTVANILKAMDWSYKVRFGTDGNLLFALVQDGVLHLIEDFDQSTPELSVKYHQMSPSGTVTTRLVTMEDIICCCRALCPVFSEQEIRAALENMAHYKTISVKEKGGE